MINPGTWSRISNAAITDGKVSHAAFRVLAALGIYVNDDGICYPSLSTLASQLGITRRQVQRLMRQLEARGYVTSHRQIRIKGGGYASNVYLLEFPPFEKPARTDPADARRRGMGSGKHQTPSQPHAMANENDATSSTASRDEIRPKSAPRCDIHGPDDATLKGTYDATLSTALTSPFNYPIGTSPKLHWAEKTSNEREEGSEPCKAEFVEAPIARQREPAIVHGAPRSKLEPWQAFERLRQGLPNGNFDLAIQKLDEGVFESAVTAECETKGAGVAIILAALSDAGISTPTSTVIPGPGEPFDLGDLGPWPPLGESDARDLGLEPIDLGPAINLASTPMRAVA